MHLQTRVAVLLLVLSASSAVQAAGPRIESLTPGLGSRGTTFDLKVEGSQMTAGADLMFYRSGLTCTGVKVESDTVVLAKLRAADDCALGSHPFRIRTDQGLSEVRVVRVLAQPIVNEAEPNNTAAQVIQPGTTVVGMTADGDVDQFKLTLKAGQRLSAEVEGVRLAAKLSDMKLTILGPDAKVLATADDTPLGKQDPYLTLLAPVDGDYVVQLEVSEAGSGDSRYALHLGHFPRPDFVYPNGGRAGQSVSVRVRGDATAQWEQAAFFTEVGTRDFYPELDKLFPPTPIPFRISPFDNVLEQEPNNQPAEAGPMANALPIAFNGIISQPGDNDYFRFHAEGEASLDFAVYGSQLGSPIDTVIRVLSVDGSVLTSADDSMGFDSHLIWKCPATGDYLLEVVEKRRAGGERYVYRVEIKLVDPAVTEFVPRRERKTQAGQAISVPQGNRVLGFVAVKRQRWNGEAEIEFPKLPPGMVTQHGKISSDEYLMPVVFEAAKDAPIGADLVPVTARSSGQIPTIHGDFEQSVDLVAASADRLYQGVTLNRLAVAVVDPAPFRIRLQQPPTALPRDGTLSLIVHVERDEGFMGSIDVVIPYLPTWVDGPEKITIAGDQASCKFALRAHPRVAACAWPLVAEAKSNAASPPAGGNAATGGTASAAGTATPTTQAPRYRGRGRRGGASGHQVASQLLSLSVTESPLDGKIGSRRRPDFASAGPLEEVWQHPWQDDRQTPRSALTCLGRTAGDHGSGRAIDIYRPPGRRRPAGNVHQPGL